MRLKNDQFLSSVDQEAISRSNFDFIGRPLLGLVSIPF
jgi:hypothetical protein